MATKVDEVWYDVNRRTGKDVLDEILATAGVKTAKSSPTPTDKYFEPFILSIIIFCSWAGDDPLLGRMEKNAVVEYEIVLLRCANACADKCN